MLSILLEFSLVPLYLKSMILILLCFKIMDLREFCVCNMKCLFFSNCHCNLFYICVMVGV